MNIDEAGPPGRIMQERDDLLFLAWAAKGSVTAVPIDGGVRLTMLDGETKAQLILTKEEARLIGTSLDRAGWPVFEAALKTAIENAERQWPR